MNKKFFYFFVILLSFTVFIVNSCKQEDLSLASKSDAAANSAKAEDIIADAFGIMNNSANGGTKGINATCWTVTTEGVFPTYKLTISFTEGCNHRGKLRKGKIVGVLNAKWNLLNSKIVMTFDNYSLDGNALSGQLTAVYSANNNNVPTFTITGLNLRLKDATTKKESAYSTWNRTIVMKNGYSTLTDISDDEYLISGTTAGYGADGSSFNSEIKDLLCRTSCAWPVSGKITYNKGTAGEYSLNFGDAGAECDNKVIYTQDAISFNIEL